MPEIPQSHRRNFCIIAHIDHGKSTLADRLIESTGGLELREMREQILDAMDLERERGITIKAHSVRLVYRAKSGEDYELNIIDTPGHVDFNYEVSRSLSACEGALLIVDAAQGVQAQTLANVYLALDSQLEILPVLNKIDLPNADPERIKKQIEDIIGLPTDNAIHASAKTGQGIEEILEAIIKYFPPPKGDQKAPLKALVFDSWFNTYQGAVVLVRVMQGSISVGEKIKFMYTGKNYEVLQAGFFTPKPILTKSLQTGQVGFVVAGIKEVKEAKIGDTITSQDNPSLEPLPGFKEVKPMVFCGIYPIEPNQYELLKDSLEKLRLNDSAFSYEPETSGALGFGFRCGFLGLLHMEIVQERLEREYGLNLISTSPTVAYRIYTTKGEMLAIDNPTKMPDASVIDHIEEPFISVTIHVPSEYVGSIIQLCEEKRGIQKNIDYITPERVMVHYDLPFPEMMFDFYDKLKSITKGYGSIDYEFKDFQTSDLIKLNVLINGDPVDALSIIVHREKSYYRGRELVSKLREIIPRQQYEVAIQAAIGAKIVARETVKALRKDVIAKCYGGDITRKRKLLEKQKEGKKRMKQVGYVEIPQEAFLAVLKID
ncbi:MAG TPA: elongation factor 4 [Deltaproteobacteria bacterium]|nr:MAG: elongation factor 4 [Deltaproteobacteria bacterium GWA2_45_12]HBF12160.1 elongation factor 4 [Deltaproteobacteria bacterium]